MEETKTLRVRARGTASVPDFARLERGQSRGFIGRKMVPDPATGLATWQPTDEVVELPNEPPYAAEYLKALRDGDLWAADEATARACGQKVNDEGKTVPAVVFDPTYGGAVKSALQKLPATPGKES